ncbi:hypothetical protein SKAU_G00393790 [Synaphobranchus kaupii]|uniref:Uncharacterized protein n=1 Tax=Synaphobranchus kaupii TaxID=118154 RepID=A0A9Q1EC44_SYNKA|nr:hypothetical protein SKAU_G00393790 [Synaphobranchus kaupii]
MPPTYLTPSFIFSGISPWRNCRHLAMGEIPHTTTPTTTTTTPTPPPQHRQGIWDASRGAQSISPVLLQHHRNNDGHAFRRASRRAGETRLSRG